MYLAPGGLNASMRPAHDPAMAKAGLAFASEPIDYDRHDIDEQRQILVDRFAGAGWQCDALLTAAQEADDFYFDSFLQVRMPAWASGRVTLGDGKTTTERGGVTRDSDQPFVDTLRGLMP